MNAHIDNAIVKQYDLHIDNKIVISEDHMTWTKTLLVGTAVAAVLATAAWSGRMAESRASAAGRDHLDWCDGAVERLKIMNAAGPVYLGLDESQTGAWTTLMVDLRQALAGFEQACAAGMTAEPAGPAPVRLTGLRDQLATGLAAIDRIRPSFDAFYRNLDADQKQRIEHMLALGRRG